MDEYEIHEINEELLDALNVIIMDFKKYKWLKDYVEELEGMKAELKEEFDEEEERLAEKNKREREAEINDFWKSQFPNFPNF